jgi:N-acetylmuramoyl-L-alanine amidase
MAHILGRLLRGISVIGGIALALPGMASAQTAVGEIIIAIDPGHGGIDPGASANGLTESQVVLEFSHRLAVRLGQVPGFRPVLIRSDDTFLTLSQRIRLAREHGAHALISIHADTTREGRAAGAHVYTLSREGTDEAASDLAKRENRADVLGGVSLAGESDDLTALLVDLAQRGTSVEAEKLGAAVLTAMEGNVTLLPTQPHRRANFRVLKAPEIPSILVELGYLSNEEDRQRIESAQWRDRMAVALALGIQRWTRIASPGYLTPRE